MTQRFPRLPFGTRGAAVAGAAASLAFLSGGCSLLFHANADQCSTTSDCAARGPAFSALVCLAGSCIATDASVAVTDAGAPLPDVAPEAGPDAGPDAADSGAPCATAADCPPSTNPNHPEVACDIDTNTCVQLTTDECPLVIGSYKPASGPVPIFLGAFALVTNGATNDVSYLNYALAQGDFVSAGGLPVGTSGSARMPVFVVCNNDSTSVTETDVMAAVEHLVHDVHATAVIAALPPTQLGEVFGAVNIPQAPSAPANLFFINPFGADTNLTALASRGLLWHVLGQPSDLTGAYRALFPRVEAYVRGADGLAATAATKVAAVYSNSALPQDLAASVSAMGLSWTQGSIASGQNYLSVELSGSTLDSNAPSQSEINAKAQALVSFAPDIVLSYGSDEVISLLETVEALNPPVRPFYVLGPYNSGATSLLNWILNSDTRRTRFVGVNYASSLNNPVLAAYQLEFTNTYPSATLAEEQADNYYDAAYFAIYSLAAAGRVVPSGLSSGTVGMPDLVSGTVAAAIGPNPAIGNVLQALGSGDGKIALADTIGPPDFNPSTGARITPGDVYCINRNTTVPTDGGPPNLAPYFQYDVLTLAPDGGAGDAGPTLEGKFPCFSGF